MSGLPPISRKTNCAGCSPGQPVDIYVDALGRTFKGYVDGLGSASGERFSLLPPENATGNYVKVVQRIPVRIDLAPGQNSTIAWYRACRSNPRCGSSERGSGWRSVRTSLSPRYAINPWPIAFTVTIATFMEALDTSIANVALPHIAGSLSATADQATWVLTSYLVSNGIILPLGAWLSEVMGRKRFYMTCVALFTVCSFLCGIAPSLGMLILFRVLQGAGGGGLQPSEQAILADTFPPERLGMAFAIYGMAVVLAPSIGPTLGGWITDNYSWRWIFYINVPIGIISLLLTNHFVQDPDLS